MTHTKKRMRQVTKQEGCQPIKKTCATSNADVDVTNT